MNKFLNEIRKGSSLLDEKMPGWHNKINLDELSMAGNCILAQLYATDKYPSGGYQVGMAALGLEWEMVINHGFTVTPGVYRDADMKILTDEWKEFIEIRRGIPAQPADTLFGGLYHGRN